MRLGPSLLMTLLGACAPGPEAFRPAVVYVEGAFGYDAAADAAVPYTTEGTPVTPTVVLSVASEAWFDTFAEADRCAVVLRHVGEDPLPRAAWTAEAGAWFGFDLPVDATIESDCAGWDPDVWGDDPGAALAAWGWGLGLGALDEDVHDEVRAAVLAADGEASWDDTWAPSVLGGGFAWSGGAPRFDGGFAPHDYAFGLVVGESFETVVQDGAFVVIPADEATDGTPPTGAYVLQSWFGLDADLLAPTNL